MGVTIFSVGIGKEFKKDELDEMATDPDSAHVLTGDFDQLDQLLPKIKEQSCTGEYARKCQQAPTLSHTGEYAMFNTQSNIRLRPPLLSDRFSKHQKFTSQITIFGTSCKQTPLTSDRNLF